MMESPGWYYEANLKGKTAAQIESTIRSLKRKNKKLQKVVANPTNYPLDWMICPDPKVRLEVYRLYLQKGEEGLMLTLR